MIQLTLDLWQFAKRKLSLRALLLAAVGLLAATEISARVAGFGDPPLVVLDKEIEYYLAPGRTYRRLGQQIAINSYGMRSLEVDFARADRASLHAMLGDSIVFGYGLDQPDIVPARLQQRLRKINNSPDVVVSSIAASSWGPENILAFYRRFGPFRGDVAWIVQSTHDMVDVMHQPNDPPPYKSQPTPLALQDIGISLWRRASTRLGLGGDGGQTYEANRKRSDRALAELITTLKGDYARVVLVFHANRAETAGETSVGPDHFRGMADAHGIAFLSTVELYRQAASTGRSPHFDDIHLSVAGAEMLSEFLVHQMAASSTRSPRPLSQ